MSRGKKIVLLWLSFIAIYVASMAIFPHREIPLSGNLNRAMQVLLCLIAWFVFRSESSRNNKIIFLNFVVYFSLSVLTAFHDFVGIAVFRDVKYAGFFYYQYLSLFSIFCASISIMYLVVDVLFHDFKISHKYLATGLIVLTFFSFYFFNFLSDPMFLYGTEDIKQWKTLVEQLPTNGEIPPATDLAANVTLQSWSGGSAIGVLYPEENLKRITELLPYLEGDNWLALFWKPMYEQIIKMNVLLIVFIVFSFGYQYRKDPPQGAYIDKILFLLLLWSSMEILHNWGYIKNVEWGSMADLFSIGQYVTFVVELLMVLFFALRLNFINSIQGEYYEAELAANPNQVTRWRDWIDNLVLSHFFNYKIFNGRLFQKTSDR